MSKRHSLVVELVSEEEKSKRTASSCGLARNIGPMTSRLLREAVFSDINHSIGSIPFFNFCCTNAAVEFFNENPMLRN